MTFVVPQITLAVPTETTGIVALSWAATVGTGPHAGNFTGFNVVRNSKIIATGLSALAVSYSDASIQPSTAYIYQIQGGYDNVAENPPILSNTQSFTTTAYPTDVFNCDCESVSPWDTLANVRTRMMYRLGYTNAIANPPPGMAGLLNQFLSDAQKQLYKKLNKAGLRTERFFKWTMVPGQRFYNFASEEVSCEILDPLKVKWVGFEDLNKAWYRLDEGIPPEYYTRANISFGWPTRYELRSCIELFPAPQAAYTLWIKGDFGLDALSADGDRFTIDDEMVYLLALGNAKAHYGQGDAQLVLTQAGDYVKGMVAGTHGTRRYVPQASPENPLTPPKFLPLGTNQA